MAKKEQKEKSELRALYLKTDSLNDLIRNAISQRQVRVVSISSGKKYMLLSEGEKPDGTRIIYQFEVPNLARYILYGADESGESVELTDDLSSKQDHYKLYRLPVIEIVKSPYAEAKKDALKEISISEAKDYAAIVRSLVKLSGEEEMQPKVYAFFSGKEHIIGTFDIFWEHGKVFTYAKINSKDKFSGLSYDYNTDSVEKVNVMAGSSKIHINVINLAEPFPFFKP